MDDDNKKISPADIAEDDYELYEKWIAQHSAGVDYSEDHAENVEQITRNLEWLDYALEADFSHLESDDRFVREHDNLHNENLIFWADERQYWRACMWRINAKTDT